MQMKKSESSPITVQPHKSESRIQQEIVNNYHNNYCLPHHSPRCMIFHIPNQNQHRLTAIGVYPGAADLFVWHFGRLIFFEVKEPEKGKQSVNQDKFEAHCKQSGIPYHIVYSEKDFIELIKNYEKNI